MTDRKFCRSCGTEINEHNGILQNTNSFGKYRTLCKPCKNKQGHEYRAARKDRDREQVKQEVESKPDNIVPPRTFVYLNQSYIPESGYVRNMGLKHIPSVGVRC